MLICYIIVVVNLYMFQSPCAAIFRVAFFYGRYSTKTTKSMYRYKILSLKGRIDNIF